MRGILYTPVQILLRLLREHFKKSREVLEEVKDTDLKDLKEGAEKIIDDTKKKVEKKIK